MKFGAAFLRVQKYDCTTQPICAEFGCKDTHYFEIGKFFYVSCADKKDSCGGGLWVLGDSLYDKAVLVVIWMDCSLNLIRC